MTEPVFPADGQKRIRIPRQAEEIIEKLNSRGFEAYAVGGCVRDSLLGKEPEDWDITTSARPEQVKAIFGRTVDTGIKHGTVTVMRGRTGCEVTTFRIDGEYKDGRHPGSVEFTSDLAEDLRRRDFTINAMAYSRRTGLVDLFGGLDDLRNRRICCVGDPRDRFAEDALRILRALRFSAQLGFSVEERTESALRLLAPNLARISRERVQAELTKILLSDRPGAVRQVFAWGLAPYVSETFSRMDAAEIYVSPRLPAVRHMRWAACLRRLSPREAEEVLRELKLDNDTIFRVKTLVEWQCLPIGTEAAQIRRVMSRMPPELFDDLLVLKQASEPQEDLPTREQASEPQEDLLTREQASEPQEDLPMREQASEPQEDLRQIACLAEEIRSRGDCVSLKELAVTGADLIAEGMEPGRTMGEVLAHLLELVLGNPELNTRQRLLEEARNYTGKRA